ncbi:MAG TPA: glycosyltransferase family 4 protein [Noviherbaspirillum sp.]|nr:glycosyltransferase family 4 protein [Noviherbaspirillum sp.]
MPKIALITNHPPPFRIPIYDKLASMADVDLQVIFCSEREPNRQWELPPLRFNHVFLKEHFVARGSNFIHNNPDVIPALKRFAPDVIITTGFNPTYLYAFAYAVIKGIPHVPMTDGTDASEQSLSVWHKLIRRLVYSRSRAFIAASQGGQRLYESYGIPTERCFRSCLCIDNEAYWRTGTAEEKNHDLIFCGRIVSAKNPLFALEVSRRAAEMLGRKIRVLFVGNGEQKSLVQSEASRLTDFVEATFHGHAAQEDLPALYGSARIFLFPTMGDVWGVVANEACAAGLPVIVSPHAGVAGELVVDGENGFVRPLDVAQWTDCVVHLLRNESTYQRYARKSLVLASRYTFEGAATGIVEACRHAAGGRHVAALKQASGKAG